MGIRELRAIVQYSSLISHSERSILLNQNETELRHSMRSGGTSSLLSELPLFVTGKYKFDVPVYVVHGSDDDYVVLEKFRTGSIHIPNLYILDERNSFAINLGSWSLRLFGLGGFIRINRLFDVGDANHGYAGAAGQTWATAMQMGELLDLSQRLMNNKNELRILATRIPAGNEPLVGVIAKAIKADYTFGTSHTRLISCFNDFSVYNMDLSRYRLDQVREPIMEMWNQIRRQAGHYLDTATMEIRKIETFIKALEWNPQSDFELKDCWHIGIINYHHGTCIMNISTTNKSIGFDMHTRKNPIHPLVASSSNDNTLKESSKWDKTSLVISNLPPNIDLDDLKNTFFKGYNLSIFKYLNNFRDRVHVQFKTRTECEKALTDLKYARYKGNVLKSYFYRT